jgi:hypothetical protein
MSEQNKTEQKQEFYVRLPARGTTFVCVSSAICIPAILKCAINDVTPSWYRPATSDVQLPVFISPTETYHKLKIYQF